MADEDPPVCSDDLHSPSDDDPQDTASHGSAPDNASEGANNEARRGRRKNQKRELVIFADGEDDPLSNVDKESIYPEWSWDRTRTWVAIRRGDKYSYDQIRALADQDIVMLEKFNGHATYGTVEQGSLEAAKRIKGINSKVKVLFYLNSMVHYAGYAANDDFKNEWAMWNPERNDYYKWRDKFLSYDHTNAGNLYWAII